MDEKQSAVQLAMRISIMNLLAGLVFWGFGIAMFIFIGQSQQALEANLRMIETGEARQVELTVDRKWVQRGNDKSKNYWASFSPYNESRWFTYNRVDDTGDRTVVRSAPGGQ